jgi:riboflavin synthase
MFTGIIETIGRVSAFERTSDLARLAIQALEIADGVKIGDSIAVNGGCLTVTSLEGGVFTFEAIQETLDKTTLGGLQVGSRVNLERAMRADARLDGHLVQGHVDGTGRVRKLERVGEDVRLSIACGPEIQDCLVEKGSITIDGVSLTVVGVDDAGFDVALIPHTLAVTTLSELEPGDAVNLEADVLGKYVKRYLDRVLPRGGPVG